MEDDREHLRACIVVVAPVWLVVVPPAKSDARSWRMPYSLRNLSDHLELVNFLGRSARGATRRVGHDESAGRPHVSILASCLGRLSWPAVLLAWPAVLAGVSASLPWYLRLF